MGYSFEIELKHMDYLDECPLNYNQNNELRSWINVRYSEHIYDLSCGASRDPNLQSRDFEVQVLHSHILFIGHVTLDWLLQISEIQSHEDWKLG